jgi:hypothetical protein
MFDGAAVQNDVVGAQVLRVGQVNNSFPSLMLKKVNNVQGASSQIHSVYVVGITQREYLSGQVLRQFCGCDPV